VRRRRLLRELRAELVGEDLERGVLCGEVLLDLSGLVQDCLGVEVRLLGPLVGGGPARSGRR